MPASIRPHKIRLALRYVFLRVLGFIIHLLLSCLSTCLYSFHALSWAAFENLSIFLGVPPLPVIKPSRSAVIVLGADDNTGSSLVLRLSDLGYTIFALFPCQNESLTGQNEDTRKTSKVASLLYAWHRMKESKDSKSRDSSGIVIPMSLDSKVSKQRIHAHETVRAYCTTHSLYLVAMIACPPAPCDTPGSPEYPPVVQGRLYETNTTLDLLDQNLSNSVAREITEPLLLVQDYLSMLREAQGRILIISPCPISGIGSTSPLDGARRAISRGLSNELSDYRLSVTNILTSPLRSNTDDIVMSSETISNPSRPLRVLTHRPLKLDARFADALSYALLPFKISEDKLFSAVQHVILSRYPRSSYSIGIHPYLRTVLDLEFIKLWLKFAIN